MMSFGNAAGARPARAARVVRVDWLKRARAGRPMPRCPWRGRVAGSVRVLRVSPRFVSGAGTLWRPGPIRSGPPARVVSSWRERLSQVCRDHPRRLQRSCNAASVRRIRVRMRVQLQPFRPCHLMHAPDAGMTNGFSRRPGGGGRPAGGTARRSRAPASTARPAAVFDLCARRSDMVPAAHVGTRIVLRIVFRFFGFLFSWLAIGSIMALAGLGGDLHDLRQGPARPRPARALRAADAQPHLFRRGRADGRVRPRAADLHADRRDPRPDQAGLHLGRGQELLRSTAASTRAASRRRSTTRRRRAGGCAAPRPSPSR